MANRSYLYSLSNRPAAYVDRPETISGLSEWPYDVPFMYRLLMSGDPQPCASLVSDGMEDEEPGSKTRLYAISGVFEPGYARVRRCRYRPRRRGAGAGSRAWVHGGGQRFRRVAAGVLHGPREADVLAASGRRPDAGSGLVRRSRLGPAAGRAGRNAGLRRPSRQPSAAGDHPGHHVPRRRIARCRPACAARAAGQPANVDEAARALRTAVAEPAAEPLDAFHGLRLDNDFDSTRTGATERPVGLYWSDVLYFELFNRSQFEAHLQQG